MRYFCYSPFFVSVCSVCSCFRLFQFAFAQVTSGLYTLPNTLFIQRSSWIPLFISFKSPTKSPSYMHCPLGSQRCIHGVSRLSPIACPPQQQQTFVLKLETLPFYSTTATADAAATANAAVIIIRAQQGHGGIYGGQSASHCRTWKSIKFHTVSLREPPDLSSILERSASR